MAEKEPIDETAADIPMDSGEPKSMVASGDEVMQSNPNSLGYGIQQIKLEYWDPENEKYWEAEGKYIAKRNLITSIPNLLCAFGVWLVWSVITSKIQLAHDADPSVYHFPDWGSPEGKEYRSVLYLLPAVAGISGGTLRIPNSFMTQCAGGRNVIFNTTFLLALPMMLAGIALKNPDVGFNFLLTCSLLSGVGGGAFASSMSNINFFFPRKLQGYALGMNGGLGNLGVSVSQLVAPLFMGAGFGAASVSSETDTWPYNAGWLWFSLCVPSGIFAFFWMNNQPTHGEKTTLQNLINFWWMEIVGLFASFLAVITLIYTRDDPVFQSSGGKIGRNFLLVLIAAIIEHVFMWFLTPASPKERVRTQAIIFREKHNWVMTFLYIMCFGSFIGYSGSFPKLIQDLFGYIEDEDGNEITNPNAPNVFHFAWMGAAVGSLIRPIGGVLSDKYGGAKVTMIAIIVCTAAAMGQAVLVQQTRQLDKPEKNFGLFLFLFLVLFLCTGTMNGSTFRTIGVLFEPEVSGPVLGWSSAIASYGAFVIPAMFGVSMAAGKPETTFWALSGYYVACGIVNFWYYVRPGCEKPGV
mmetsp:Transcript_48347/g.71652  ORF Transcript_48347/g.71652 Transcript_48347/m.71652 type:complete len:579 (-) Transcript_48347:373-2109(-)|eukprot:CAMPEP_0195518872 /NCGR_PEP_ID=MMETSP0794_2-20130614/13832_1 /TAXON_ID=515487 /ORGANISM="Stephanopyxis turris, Strain CCMP 815" /LENGTH=578 /DNA_ID=CAMNT_0040647903 /DNA_START=40 /DNA_END=1776 /DNA_ORIENTATION=+